MTSNALSPRRNYLKRPIVCKASPPPPVPSSFTCDCVLFLSEGEEIEPEEESEFTIGACAPDYPAMVRVRPVLTASAGEWSSAGLIANCEDHINPNWEAPEDPGFVLLSMEITWPRGEVCGASVIVEVPGEDDDDDDD